MDTKTQPNAVHDDQIPAEILRSEARSRDPRTAHPVVTDITDLLHVPRLDGGPVDIIVRYAPLLALVAAFTAAFPVITAVVAMGTETNPNYVMGQVVVTLAFSLAFIWLAERNKLGLFAAGFGSLVQTAAAAFMNPRLVVGSLVELVVIFIVLVVIRHRYE